MNIVNKKTKDIIPYENNPRNNKAAVELVSNSIKTFGFKVPIILDSDNTIVCGHTRLLAAKELGMEEIPCILADDLTPEQIKAFRLADNKVSEKATWDMDSLAEELKGIDVDMSQFGFFLEPVDVSDIEECYIDTESKMDIKIGDIFLLGEHRLMCGDCCNAESVIKLFGGACADLYITDPPYNVDYESAAGKIQNDNMGSVAFREFLAEAFSAADSVMKLGAAFYIWHSETEGLSFRLACNDTRWKVRQCLIWNKDHFTLSRQDYQWKHEPCLYGWKGGAAHYFRPCRKNNTVFEDALLQKKTKEDLIEIILGMQEDTTVIDVEKPVISVEHPTMKPIELIAKLIMNSSKSDEIVYDSFGGSGTTLLACEQLARKCFMMELDPYYAGVIIHRWEKFTGETAVKIN